MISQEVIKWTFYGAVTGPALKAAKACRFGVVGLDMTARMPYCTYEYGQQSVIMRGERRYWRDL